MDMSPVKYVAIVTTAGQNAEIVDDLMRFRKALFVDLLNWDLITHGGIERDEFDDDHTVHVAILRRGELIGGFRAIRTDRPYLAAKVFPMLAVTARYPRRRDAWEISRFGVLPQGSAQERFDAARTNYAVMMRFAQLRDATSLVAIADLSYERFLRTIGIRTRRFGPPSAVCTDAAGNPLELVAGEIPIAEQGGPRFASLMACLSRVEIQDETYVLGPEAVPA